MIPMEAAAIAPLPRSPLDEELKLFRSIIAMIDLNKKSAGDRSVSQIAITLARTILIAKSPQTIHNLVLPSSLYRPWECG